VYQHEAQENRGIKVEQKSQSFNIQANGSCFEASEGHERVGNIEDNAEAE
jgi:hypothetical protein